VSHRIAIRPAARRDLLKIGIDSEVRWGREQTRIYLVAISDVIERIAATPNIGSDRSHISSGLRKSASGVHHIYYRVVDDTVVIVRVMHQRMDVSSQSMAD